MSPRLLLPVLLLVLSACSAADGRGSEPVSTEAPLAGACRMLTPEDIKKTSNDTPTIDCTKKHTAETFAVGEFPTTIGDDIDDPALGSFVFETCENKFRKFLGGDESRVMRSTVTWAWFRPTDDAWDEGARWWRCDVVGGGEESTSLVSLPTTAEGILRGMPKDRWMVCVNGPTVAASEKIPCSEKHTWRAVTTIVLGDDKDDYPGDRLVEVRTRDYCSDSVGAWLNYPVDYDYGYTWFHEPEWDSGNRRSICWARTPE